MALPKFIKPVFIQWLIKFKQCYAAGVLYFIMMRKFLLLAAAFLFSANIFAADSITVADRALHNFDLVGPAISFTLLAQSSCVTARNFTATITDIDGVDINPRYKAKGVLSTGWRSEYPCRMEICRGKQFHQSF